MRTRALSAALAWRQSAIEPRERLREHGIRADLMPRAFIGEEIARALIERAAPGDRVLVYRAQEARDVLPRMLEEAGLRPDVVAAYKTIFARPPNFEDAVARADVLTFTSASTVRGFCAALGGDEPGANAARGKCVACIGPITAQAATGAGLTVDVIATVFTTAGLLDALASILRRQNVTQLTLAAALAGAVALLAYRARTLTIGGAVAAFAVGTAVFGAGGWRAAAVLFAFFIPSAILSRVGSQRKRTMGDEKQAPPQRMAGFR